MEIVENAHIKNIKKQSVVDFVQKQGYNRMNIGWFYYALGNGKYLSKMEVEV